MDLPSLSLDPLIARRIVETILLLAAALLLTEIGRRLALHTFDDQERQYKASKWMSRVLWGLALLLIVALWSPSASTFLTVLTIIGAGLAVALRDVLLSFVGWIHLSLHPPYRQGDGLKSMRFAGTWWTSGCCRRPSWRWANGSGPIRALGACCTSQMRGSTCTG